MELAFLVWDQEIEAGPAFARRALGCARQLPVAKSATSAEPSKKSASIHAIIMVRSGTMEAFRTLILAAKATTCTSIRISS
jgi:hypothetical protein